MSEIEQATAAPGEKRTVSKRREGVRITSDGTVTGGRVTMPDGTVIPGVVSVTVDLSVRHDVLAEGEIIETTSLTDRVRVYSRGVAR